MSWITNRPSHALPAWIAACCLVGWAQATPPNGSQSEEEMRRQLMEQMGLAAPEQREATEGIQVVIQTGHAGMVTAVAISPDGRSVLSGGQDESIKLWDVASAAEVRSFSGRAFAWPTALAFGGGGTRLVVTDLESTRIYEAASGRELLHLPGGSWPLLVAGNGNVIIGETPLRGRPEVLAIDTATGNVAWSVPVSPLARALACNHDGHLLATLTSERGARSPHSSLEIWDLTAHVRRAHAEVSLMLSESGLSAALSPDGATLAIENADRNVELIDTATGKSSRTLVTDARPESGLLTQIAFSPDGSSLVWATGSDLARLWRVADGSATPLAASAVAWSHDGRTLVLGHGSGGAPVIRDLVSGEERAFAAGAAEVTDVATAGSHAIVTAMHDGSARWWDLSTGEIMRAFRCPAGAPATSVAVSATRQLVALGCEDGSASLFDAATANLRSAILPPAPGEFAPVQVRFADDSTLVIAHKDEILEWDAGGARELRRFTVPGLPPSARGGAFPMSPGAAPSEIAAQSEQRASEARNWIRAIALQPRADTVAVGRQNQLALFDLRTGQLVRELAAANVLSSLLAGRGGTVMMPAPKSSRGKMPMGSFPAGLPGFPGGVPGAMGDPMAALDSMLPKEGANSIAFSLDGRLLVSLGTMGQHVFDTESGRELAAPATGTDPQQLMTALAGAVGSVFARGVAVSSNGRSAATALGRTIKIWDIASQREIVRLKGHTSEVTALAFVDDRTLLSGGRDGAVRVWRLPDGRELAALTALGRQDYIVVTPDQYYRASKSRLQGVSFRVEGKLYPFEQFDLRFNRPDIVLERLGSATPELVQTYRHAYQRRLKKMGFTEAMLGRDFHLPQVEILSKDVPLTTSEAALKLRVRASDDKFALDRILAYVNDVPVFGAAGRKVAARGHTVEEELNVPLVAGRNKIQVSALNEEGVESLRQTLYTSASPHEASPDIWVIAIGVSHYQNSHYNLRYAAKDAGDIAALFQSRISAAAPPGETPATGPSHGSVHVLPITDSQATRAGIATARDWLAAAHPQDLVVVFVAGHGMIDAEQNYFFGTFDIDPAHPASRGLPFEEFENILDGIAPLQKVLLVDTCFSGEIERDEPATASSEVAGGNKVTMRAFEAIRGVNVAADPSLPAGSGAASPPGMLPDYARFQRDWFADLRRGTGAAVISSSSGNEYSLEGEQWHNGVFTYAVLDGLKNGKADRNGDGTVSVSELESYVIDSVRALTKGAQNPTVRRENLDFDFVIY
jgi:WD40 repeat protein